MGRQGWFDEVMRFFDRHVKGDDGRRRPANVVQTSDGTWRAEAQLAARRLAAPVDATLNAGDYTDDGQNNGTGERRRHAASGRSRRGSPQDAHFAGVPKVDRRRRPTRRANANLVVDVYDIDSGRDATLISRGAYLLRRQRARRLRPLRRRLEAPGRPPRRRADHQRQRRVVGSTCRRCGTVTVRDARIELPFLRVHAHGRRCRARQSVKLEDYQRRGAVQRARRRRSRQRRARRLRRADRRRLADAAPYWKACPLPTTFWPTLPSGRRSPRSPSATATTSTR